MNRLFLVLAMLLISTAYGIANDTTFAHYQDAQRWQDVFDDSGNVIEAALFSSEGLPVCDGDGIHLYKSKFQDDQIIETAYFGLNGEPVLSNKGEL